MMVFLVLSIAACDSLPDKYAKALVIKDYKKIAELHAEYPYDDIVFTSGDSPIHYALINNDPTLLALLLKSDKRHAMLRHENAKGLSPLMLAADLKLPLVTIEQLVEANANLYHSHNGYYIMDYARDSKDTVLLDYLFDQLFDSYSGISKHKEAIRFAQEGDLKSLKYVASYELYLNYQGGEFGDSILGAGVFSGNVDLVSWLLSRHVDINLGDSEQRTPLMTAVIRADIAMTQLLLNASVDVNLEDKQGLTALHYVAMNEDKKLNQNMLLIAKSLLKAGASINANNSYLSPIGAALANKKLQLAEFFIKNGADLEFKDKWGNTAFTHAVSYGNISVVKLLLPHVKDFSTKGEGGLSALEIAKANPKKKDKKNMIIITELLEKKEI